MEAEAVLTPGSDHTAFFDRPMVNLMFTRSWSQPAHFSPISPLINTLTIMKEYPIHRECQPLGHSGIWIVWLWIAITMAGASHTEHLWRSSRSQVIQGPIQFYISACLWMVLEFHYQPVNRMSSPHITLASCLSLCPLSIFAPAPRRCEEKGNFTLVKNPGGLTGFPTVQCH